tara:strand:+ start:445 stop:861 length:417 start_codon:yes stop_codon:yes gene_type:complete
MAFNYRSGLGHAAAYLAAGRPYLTGSESMGHPGNTHKIEFGAVTRSITVVASGSNSAIRIHFKPTGSYNTEQGVMTGRHYVTLDSDEDSVTFNVKCKEIYLTNVQCDISKNSAYQLFAELTTIDTGDMYALTGSGITA